MKKVNVAWTSATLFLTFGYLLQLLTHPIREGRDFGTYEVYFRDIWCNIPEYPVIMLFRTPMTSLVFGGLFELGSSLLLHFYFYACFLIIGLVIFSVAKKWSITIAFISIGFLCISFQFFVFFNSVASEQVTATIAAIWFGFLFHNRNSNRISTWVIAAFLVFLLVLTRPNHQVFLLTGFLPLIVPNIRISRKLFLMMVFGFIYGIQIFSYCSYNYVRYDKFELAHLGPAHMPFYRIFIHEKLVRPENGESSKKLAEIVRRRVLSRENFKSYNITEDVFFEAATPRFWIYIVDALNQEYGYLNNNKLLKEVSFETHAAYPLEFWLTYIEGLKDLFEFPRRFPLRPKSHIDLEQSLERITAIRAGYALSGLDIPSEKDLVPSGLSQLTFQEKGYEELRKQHNTYLFKTKKWEWRKSQPLHLFQRVFFLISYLRPSISYCFLFGLIALGFFYRSQRLRSLTFLVGIIVVMLSATSLANPEVQFRYLFDPFLILWGTVSFFLIIKVLIQMPRIIKE